VPEFCSTRVRTKHFVFTMAALLASMIASITSCGDYHTAGLHAADDPVRPLVHTNEDFTAVFPESFPMQAAVYWTKSDEGILALIHSLREMGIPFFVTRDLDRALRHRLVVISPAADGATFTEPQIRQLTAYVEDGGNIFATNVFAGALKELFGFSNYAPSRRRYYVNFVAGADSAERYINRPEELQTRLGDPRYGNIFWTNGYTSDGTSTALAHFEDGTAAVLHKITGKGSTYLCGVSLLDVVLRSQVNGDYDAERHYANIFEPGADVWMLVLRAWYESHQPGAVRLGTIPDGQRSVLLLSHDVDWERSFDPMLAYARMEMKHHTRSSFMIQTKYVSDDNSRSFYFGKNLADLRQVYAWGFTIGSHSVIHSAGFNHFALGTGKETFTNYRPYSTGFETAKGASVFGEVRVAKELIDGELPGQNTIFFRAPNLRIPDTLPEVLQRCGYEFDSSFTADDVLTHFPYALPLGLEYTEDSGIDEFPITIEDTEGPPAPPLEQRIPQAMNVIRANAENGAINVVLIHSNEAGKKLAGEEQILDELPVGVSAMDLITFAKFWRARSSLHWRVGPWHASQGIQIDVTADDPVEGITFEFQRDIAAADAGAKLIGQRTVVLPALKLGERLSVHVMYLR